jgi:hypothetical protein
LTFYSCNVTTISIVVWRRSNYFNEKESGKKVKGHGEC